MQIHYERIEIRREDNVLLLRTNKKDTIMNKTTIEDMLRQLGDMLTELEQKKPIRLMIYGGAYMLTQIGNRNATTDIDGKVLDIANRSDSQDYLTFLNATRFVADDNKMAYSWFSDNISDFITELGPLPELKLWFKAGMLEVYVPPAGYMLAQKLQAGREKDDDDIRALAQKLKIHTRRQAEGILAIYITNHDAVDQKKLKQTLNIYFPR